MTFEIQIGERTQNAAVRALPGGGWEVTVDGQPCAADITAVTAHTISILLDGRSYTVAWERLEHTAAASTLWLGGATGDRTVEVRDPRRMVAQRSLHQTGRIAIKAPMAGKVVRVLAAVGDPVEAGQGLLVLEAMKMQNEVRSPKAGAVVALGAQPGMTVATGQLLAEVE